MNPFPQGTELQIRLTKEGKSFNASALVAYCQVGVGMGVLFAKADPEQISILEKWFAELRGETKPEIHILEAEERPSRAAAAKNDEHYILEDLLVLLLRKGVLTEEDAEPLFHRLLH